MVWGNIGSLWELLEDAGLGWLRPVVFFVLIVGFLVFLVVVFANISPSEPTPP